MRRGLTTTALALALLSLGGPTAAEAQEDSRDCFWQGGSRTTNVAYPDLGAFYWISAFPLPPGAELVFRGKYPRARYFSFNVYDPALQPTDALPDVDIEPDPGSSNPFLAGARRDGAKRSYTVRVVSGTPPAKRERNTVYLNAAGQAAQAGQIIYRTYVPDRGLESDGGAGLPEVSMKLPNGTEIGQPLTCAKRDSTVGPTIDGAQANTDGPNAQGTPGATDPLHWEAFFNYAQAFSYPVGGTPAAGGRAVAPREKLGGFLSNVDNAYTLALASRGLGPVMVLQGKAPTTPKTLDGRTTMESGQVRYWSLCENEFASQRVIDCLYDEQVPLSADGRFTIVMSTPAARPKNAREACGVSWMAWGAQPDGLLILRHMLPSPDFAQAIQRVQQVGEEEKTVGDYLPRGKHTTQTAFESRGCAGATRFDPAGTGDGNGLLGTKGTCLRRGRVTLRLRAPRGAKLRSARVRVGGKRVRARIRKGRAVVRVDLSRVRGSKVTITLIGRTVRGRRVRVRTSQAVCAAKKKPAKKKRRPTKR